MKYVLILLTLFLMSSLALANGGNSCSNSVAIGGCPFSDSGNFDNDNDCSVPSAAPYSEVFYSFTPTVSGAYQFRATTTAGSIGIRVMSGSCCSGGTSVGYSSTNVASDCGETANRRTYLSVTLTAGTNYWIQVGTNSSGTSTAAYTLDMACVPCPPLETTAIHNSCETAQALACGDSVLGSNATSSNPDWYSVTLSEASDLVVWAGGREWGHCISGFSTSDAKFRVYASCGASTFLAEGVNEGCDVDAVDTIRCVAAGTYYIKVFNGDQNSYILKTTCIEPSACPNVVVENQHCAGPCAGSLTNGGTTYFSLDVPIRYIITDLNVRVNIKHGRDSDLTIWLITPWADEIELSSHNGGDGANYTNTVFDDEASTSIICTNTSCAPFTGSFIPEQPLSDVDGFNALGTWQLKIHDPNTVITWTNDTGSVFCWCLEFDFDHILAVELNSFSATGTENSVNLAWETASELGNDHFEILRDEQMLAEVAGHANSPTGHRYSYSDGNVQTGRSYLYKLVAVDLNGARAVLATQSASATGGAAVVSEFALHQNFPNPFNPETTIRFDLPEAANVKLVVVDALGREVATLVNGMQSQGTHSLVFDAGDLPSGLYFYRMTAGHFTSTQKMLLLK